MRNRWAESESLEISTLEVIVESEDKRPKVRFYKSKLFWMLFVVSYFAVDYVVSKSSGSYSYWAWLQSYNQNGEVLGELTVRLVESFPLIFVLAYIVYKLFGIIPAFQKKS